MTATPAAKYSHGEHGVHPRRAVIAATVGTTIEWYDLFLYSVVTGFVVAKLYFPKFDRLVGALEAFTIYAVGFAAHPIGAAIFGHNGYTIAHSVTFRSERYQHRHASAVFGVGALVQLLDEPLFFQPSFHPNAEQE